MVVFPGWKALPFVFFCSPLDLPKLFPQLSLPLVVHMRKKLDITRMIFKSIIEPYLLKSPVFGRENMFERILGRLQPLLGIRSEAMWNYLNKWKDLRFYSKVTIEAYVERPFAPQVPIVFSNSYRGIITKDMGKAYFHPSSGREYDEGSHYYGHDIVVKRYAGLPLVGNKLPLIIEHGLQFAPLTSYSTPMPGIRAYLCMGPGRANCLASQFSGQQAIAIGPMINYAHNLTDQQSILKLRAKLGPVLLVILAHGWEGIKRKNAMDECVRLVQQVQSMEGYQTVFYLRHWADPQCIDLPHSWRIVCNGHRLNPFFLDSLKTLFTISDGMVTNIIGTHLGYALALKKNLHIINSDPSHEYSGISQERTSRELVEQDVRRKLIYQVKSILQEASSSRALANSKLIDLLDPYWGFRSVKKPAELRQIINDLCRDNTAMAIR